MRSDRFKNAVKPYSMAILSVFIAVFSINAVAVVSSAGKETIKQELDGVGLNGMSVAAYSNNNVNITDNNLYSVLKTNSSISALTPVLFDYSQTVFSNSVVRDTLCWGISPSAKEIVNLELIHGRMISDSDTDNNSLVCLVDETLAVSSYGRRNIIGKYLSVTTGTGNYNFKIIGIVNKTSNILNSMSGEIIPDFIYIPYTVMEKIYSRLNYDQIIINVNDTAVTDRQIESHIKRSIPQNSSISLKISDLNKQRESINNIVDTAFLALFAVSCVAVIVCSISVATSVGTAVNSSRHDIGIKISLGADKSDIMAEFLLYSLIACITGILSAVCTGAFILTIINLILNTSLVPDMGLLLRGIFATILLTFIFSIYPSMQAAAMLPVKALNRE